MGTELIYTDDPTQDMPTLFGLCQSFNIASVGRGPVSGVQKIIVVFLDTASDMDVAHAEAALPSTLILEQTLSGSFAPQPAPSLPVPAAAVADPDQLALTTKVLVNVVDSLQEEGRNLDKETLIDTNALRRMV